MSASTEIVVPIAGWVESLTAAIEARLAERPDAVHEEVLPSGELSREVLVADRHSVACLGLYELRDAVPVHRVIVAHGAGTPAWRVRVDGDGAWLTGAGPAEVLTAVRTWPVVPYKCVPYGYVVDGVAIAILFWRFGDPLDDAGTELEAGVDTYVREGCLLPESWRYDGGDSAPWAARFWSGVEAGEVVRLSTLTYRIGRFYGDGVTAPRFMVTSVLEEVPQLAGDYVYHHITAPAPPGDPTARWGAHDLPSHGRFAE